MSGLSNKYKKMMDFIEGRLSEEDRSRVEHQISQDPALERILEFISALKSEAKEINWVQIRNSIHILADKQLGQLKKSKGKSGRKQGIIAFDSKLLPLPEGVRPATVSARRLKFMIDDEPLEIALFPVSPNSYEIIGQLPEAMAEGDKSLELRGELEKYSCSANEYGIFLFPRVLTGNYKMQIREKKTIIAEIDVEL